MVIRDPTAPAAVARGFLPYDSAASSQPRADSATSKLAREESRSTLGQDLTNPVRARGRIGHDGQFSTRKSDFFSRSSLIPAGVTRFASIDTVLSAGNCVRVSSPASVMSV